MTALNYFPQRKKEHLNGKIEAFMIKKANGCKEYTSVRKGIRHD